MMDAARAPVWAPIRRTAPGHEVRFIRLPRHAGSCPWASASLQRDRNLKAKITAKGLFLEAVERNPGRFLKSGGPQITGIPFDLDRPMDEIRRTLSAFPVGPCSGSRARWWWLATSPMPA